MSTEQQIKDLIEDIESLDEGLMKAIKKVDYVSLAQKTHLKEKNPYGVEWADRVNEENYNHKKLYKTKKLYRGYRQVASRNGKTIYNRVKYAGYHQTGTDNMVARPILPEEIIPREWWIAIEKQIDKALRNL
jgi:hypothetical protein